MLTSQEKKTKVLCHFKKAVSFDCYLSGLLKCVRKAKRVITQTGAEGEESLEDPKCPVSRREAAFGSRKSRVLRRLLLDPRELSDTLARRRAPDSLELEAMLSH